MNPMMRRLVALHMQATRDELVAGDTWYEVARAACKDLAKRYNVTEACAAGTVAALSPRVTWKQNLKLAHAVLGNTYERGAFKANLAKAMAISSGQAPLSVLRGDKVRAFYRALRGDESATVVDVWMLRAVRYIKNITAKAYRKISAAINAAANAVGISPSRFQAIIWVVVRGKAT